MKVNLAGFIGKYEEQHKSMHEWVVRLDRNLNQLQAQVRHVATGSHDRFTEDGKDAL